MLLPIGPCVPTQDAVIIKFPARAVNGRGCACSDARKSEKAILAACRCLITPVGSRRSENGEKRPATGDARPAGSGGLFLQQHARVPAGNHHLAGVEIGDVRIAESFEATSNGSPGQQNFSKAAARRPMRLVKTTRFPSERGMPLVVPAPPVARKRRRQWNISTCCRLPDRLRRAGAMRNCRSRWRWTGRREGADAARQAQRFTNVSTLCRGAGTAAGSNHLTLAWALNAK